MAVFQTEGLHAGEFLLSEATSYRSRETVTISSTAPAMVAGQVLGKITVGGQYAPYNNANSNGTETAVAVLIYPTPDSTVAQQAAVMVRDCELFAAKLSGLDSAGRTDLAAQGIILR